MIMTETLIFISKLSEGLCRDSPISAPLPLVMFFKLLSKDVSPKKVRCSCTSMVENAARKQSVAGVSSCFGSNTEGREGVNFQNPSGLSRSPAAV